MYCIPGEGNDTHSLLPFVAILTRFKVKGSLKNTQRRSKGKVPSTENIKIVIPTLFSSSLLLNWLPEIYKNIRSVLGVALYISLTKGHTYWGSLTVNKWYDVSMCNYAKRVGCHSLIHPNDIQLLH